MNEQTADSTYLDALAQAQGAPGPDPAPVAEAPSPKPGEPMTEEDMDAALEGIEERAGIEDEDDSPTSQDETDDEEAEESEETGSVEEEPQAAAAPEDDTEAYAQALALLTAAGWSTRDILDLDRGVAIKTGEVLAKRQEAPANEQRQTEEVLPGTQQEGKAAPDWDSLRESLSVDLGEEGSKALTEALEYVATTTRPDPRVAALQKGIDGMRRMVLNQQVRNARGALETDFPGLSDDDAYARVIARADRLADSGGYDDVETAMRHACMIELPTAAKPKDSGESRTRKRQNQPSRPGRKGPKGPVSVEESYDAILNEIEDPKRRVDPNGLAAKYLGRVTN